jgi:hypothetical protein
MTPALPTDFADRLESLFNGALRLRWSQKQEVWCIEQQVGRASALPIRLDPFDDGLIRRRDGYALVMEVRPGNHMACPRCRTKLKVPEFKVAEVRCQVCTAQGIDAAYKAAWWPLGECLLDELKKLDPERVDTVARIRASDSAAATAKRLDEEAAHREGAAQLKDAFLDQLPKAGFPSLVPDGWRH